MNKPILIYKNIGETPLEAILRLKKERIELANTEMTYAGRLDPMAEGLLLILPGEERFKKEEYLALPKEYEVEILFGFETDTYDLLGLIVTTQKSPNFTALPSLRGLRHGQNSDSFVLSDIFKKFTGDIEQEYPPYSSKPVDGKPLFVWAREGKIDEIKIPTHKVHIENIEMTEQRKIKKGDLQKYIKSSIPKINGDFRQEEILNRWTEVLSESKNDTFEILKIKVLCGSGTYMRTLAHDIGKSLGVLALAFSIKRTKIGKYNL